MQDGTLVVQGGTVVWCGVVQDGKVVWCRAARHRADGTEKHGSVSADTRVLIHETTSAVFEGIFSGQWGNVVRYLNSCGMLSKTFPLSATRRIKARATKDEKQSAY